MIQKITTPRKISIDPNSTPKPQTINLDLKPYNKYYKNPYTKNTYNNLHLHASTPHLVSEHRIKTNGNSDSIVIKNNFFLKIKCLDR